MKKDYDIERGSALWRHKIREAYKSIDEDFPQKFGFKNKKNNMPLTKKGKKIEHAMEKEYGEKKGKQVFYASKNKGTIKGVEKAKSKALHKMKK